MGRVCLTNDSSFCAFFNLLCMAALAFSITLVGRKRDKAKVTQTCLQNKTKLTIPPVLGLRFQTLPTSPSATFFEHTNSEYFLFINCPFRKPRKGPPAMSNNRPAYELVLFSIYTLKPCFDEFCFFGSHSKCRSLSHMHQLIETKRYPIMHRNDLSFLPILHHTPPYPKNDKQNRKGSQDKTHRQSRSSYHLNSILHLPVFLLMFLFFYLKSTQSNHAPQKLHMVLCGVIPQTIPTQTTITGLARCPNDDLTRPSTPHSTNKYHSCLLPKICTVSPSLSLLLLILTHTNQGQM
jgi:hypothetical protein